MKKSGLADSPLFLTANSAYQASAQFKQTENNKLDSVENRLTNRIKTSNHSRKEALHQTNQATTAPRYHDTMVETIRKTVKVIGKEAATYRFTQGEKKALAETIYAFRLRGIRISENEITRIAINFLFNDHLVNKKESVIERVVEALNG